MDKRNILLKVAILSVYVRIYISYYDLSIVSAHLDTRAYMLAYVFMCICKYM